VIDRNANEILKRTGDVRIHDTHLGVWEEHVDPEMNRVLVAVLRSLEGRGFLVQQDPHVVKNYPSLSEEQWVGIRDGLEVAVNLCGRHLKVDFFQNVANVQNCNGGRYDYGKFARMPRGLGFRCLLEMRALIRLLTKIGYVCALGVGFDRQPIDPPNLLQLRDLVSGKKPESPLERFNENWGRDRFERDDTGFPSQQELRCWDDKDANGIPVRTGDTRYLRVRGRLMRGQCYPNMNGQWMFRYGGEFAYESARQFFTCDRPDLEPRRLVPEQPERLHRELQTAVERFNYRRVIQLATVLARLQHLVAAPP
jgi:hypothetical protein